MKPALELRNIALKRNAKVSQRAEERAEDFIRENLEPQMVARAEQGYNFLALSVREYNLSPDEENAIEHKLKRAGYPVQIFAPGSDWKISW